MILNGPNPKDQDKQDSQACLTIGQSNVFNSKKRSSHNTASARHTMERDPPLPIYIGINVHALTRSKKLIKQLCHMGLSISYDRIKEIEDWIATATCERFVNFNWQPTKSVYITSGQPTVTVGVSIPMQNCNHKEADTRVVVHVLHAFQQGRKTIHVRTVDTDVVVILVGKLHDLITIQPLADIWVAFGMGKHYRFYHINAICTDLGVPQSRALSVFHAFSGCDTTSAFSGKGKKSVWQAWKVYEEFTNTFVYPARNPFQILSMMTISRSWRD